jgi:hypothetical protein
VTMELSDLETVKGSMGRLFCHTKELARFEELSQNWLCEAGVLPVLVDSTG